MPQPKRHCQVNLFAPAPVNKWASFNARRNDQRRQKAEVFHQRPREPQGFQSMRSHHKVRFGGLPARWRPVAEAELHRLMNKFVQVHGHWPSQQKVASLIGNAAAIVRNHRMRQAGHNASRWKAAMNQYFRTRFLLNKVDAPPPPPALTPRQRSRWALTGV